MRGLWTWPGAAGIAAIAMAVGLAGGAAANDRIAYLADQGATSAPIGWQQFCRDNPAECRVGPLRAQTVRADRATWAILVRINLHVNAAIEPVTDMDQYGVEEKWTYPVSGQGDCEDYVLLKKRLLVEAGLPASALLVTVVRDLNGDGHAVLTVRTDAGDYVLDNENNDIRLWHVTGYRFVKRQSAQDPNRWVTVGPASAPAAVATR